VRLPLGGVAVSDRVFEAARDLSPKGLPFMFGLTYNNHPASCSAAFANLGIVEREHLVENARDVGAYLLERLRETLSDHPYVRDIHGIGLLAALECTEPGSKEPFGGRPMAFPAAVIRHACEQGLITRALWECVALAPPLCTTRSEVDEIVGILVESMHAAKS
jgi:L-2,4-diaminobutyrate transaminase